VLHVAGRWAHLGLATTTLIGGLVGFAGVGTDAHVLCALRVLEISQPRGNLGAGSRMDSRIWGLAGPPRPVIVEHADATSNCKPSGPTGPPAIDPAGPRHNLQVLSFAGRAATTNHHATENSVSLQEVAEFLAWRAATV